MLLENNDMLEIVSKFKDLPRRDRRAIERKLSVNEQQMLKRHVEIRTPIAKVEKSTQIEPKNLDMKHLSPWLSKHLKKNVFSSPNASEGLVTEATLSALSEIITTSAKA